MAALAPALAGADIAFMKVDSLLRGHGVAELAACWRLGGFDHCVIAPAFPFQGRVTCGGVQHAREGAGWRAVADLAALTRQAGLEAALAAPGAPLAAGVTIHDARTQDDLARLVATARCASGRVLWCGSAGLAHALAGGRPPRDARLTAPVLGLFGSDQDVTRRQLAACGAAWARVTDGGPASAREIAARLAREGVAMVSLALPPDAGRAAAARAIATGFAALTGALPRPGALIVSGGETLRALCSALGASHLLVTGQIEPGVPRSTLCGGRWDGLPVVSKSGAFGADDLWRDLLADNGLPGGALRSASTTKA
jgi:uncharacterized protein YgbK (DUF1537 family)